MNDAFSIAMGDTRGAATSPVREPLVEGQRVRLTRTAERFPHAVVPVGATGTVVEAKHSDVWVKMDQHVEGLDAEGWGNCLWFGADDYFTENDPPDEMETDEMLLRHCQLYLELLA